MFSRQMATMMSAGVPLVQSFDIVGRGHNNPAMQELVLSIKADVEGGTALTEALRKHPLHFDDLFCNLVQAGERPCLRVKHSLFRDPVFSVVAHDELDH